MCPVIHQDAVHLRVQPLTVKRPREIVPTNLVMLIGHGIVVILLCDGDGDYSLETGQLLLVQGTSTEGRNSGERVDGGVRPCRDSP
jgi:hypothetical protein